MTFPRYGKIKNGRNHQPDHHQRFLCLGMSAPIKKRLPCVDMFLSFNGRISLCLPLQEGAPQFWLMFPHLSIDVPSHYRCVAIMLKSKNLPSSNQTWCPLKSTIDRWCSYSKETFHISKLVVFGGTSVFFIGKEQDPSISSFRVLCSHVPFELVHFLERENWGMSQRNVRISEK